MNFIEIIHILTLIFVFYTLGLFLSNLINFIFPACDFKKKR